MTVAPWAIVASLPFAPAIVLPAMEFFISQIGWVSPWHYGLNKGPIVLMIENYRTGLLWRLMRGCPYLVEGLRRAGFSGGWL